MLGAAIGLALFAAILRDAFGARYGLDGSCVWGGVFVLSFLLGSFYYAQFLLPLPWQDGWYEAQRLLFRYNFPFLAGLAKRPPGSAAKKALPAGIPPSLSVHGAGLVESHYALVLTRGGAFSRPAGPGYVALNPGERASQAVDLRRQRRLGTAQATTRDGISLELAVEVVFQIQQVAEPDPAVPYPYESQIIFQVTYLGELNTGQGTLSWADHVGRQAAILLANEVATYTLDELFVAKPDHPPRIENVQAGLKRALIEQFEPEGIIIFGVSIVGVEAQEEVIAGRIADWQAGWQRRMEAAGREVEAERQRRIGLARARAQVELIQTIANNIDSLRQSGEATLAQVVNLRMIEAMEEAAAHQRLQEQPTKPELAPKQLPDRAPEGET
ncbi:MAG: SPFH domain-containing protein [Candidatus Promineifilaceae bacterium]